MNRRLDGGQQLVLATLLAIFVITAGWWALALWPVASDAPEWLLRTRWVCFGNRAGELPDAGGWLLLIGQPLGMTAFLLVVWGGTARSAMRNAWAWRSGRVLVTLVPLAFAGGLGMLALRAARVSASPPLPATEDTGPPVWEVNRPLPDVGLVDQHGEAFVWERFAGRPLVVAFAYGHCETICPLVVQDAVRARQTMAQDGVAAVVAVVTLDPWRDTPSRLGAIARQWALEPGDVVLGGSVDEVLAALAAFDVFVVRDEVTGEVTHPALLYLVDTAGRIAWASRGGPAGVLALAERAGG